ncbi:MAG: hypothetical protein ABH803_01760, partial [Candidatus Micrarchaeota archaeon]
MGFVDVLKKIYFKIEDQYYAFCDAIEKTPVKIYEWFVNPIENRGFPSFPFFLLLIVLLFSGIAFVVLGGLGNLFTATNTLKISLSSDGLPVDGVSAKLIVDGIDSPFMAVSDSSGLLTFSGVPAGKKATLRITDPRFDSFTQTISTSSTSLSFSLNSAGGKTFTVLVINAEGDPLGGALISFTDSNGQLVNDVTDSRGSVSVSYSREDQQFYFKASKDGFDRNSVTCSPKQVTCVISLNHVDDSNLPTHLKGSVLVSVSNEAGDPVEGIVSVFNSDSGLLIDELYLEYGDAFFEELIEEGTRVYISVDPDDDALAPYWGGVVDDIKTVSSTSNTVFNIVLQRKSSLPNQDFSKMTLTVVDEDESPVQGAIVSLYLQGENRVLLLEEQTDSSGKTVLEVDKNLAYYATIYADGFMPLLIKDFIIVEKRELFLDKLLPGNNAELEVLVEDADGVEVEFAKVLLVYPDGFPVGFPAQETGADGKILFEGVPLDTIGAFASKGSLTGESDFTQVGLGENSLSVSLERGLGIVRVRARDSTEKRLVLVPVTVTAFVDEEEIGSCVTLSSGDGYCDLSIWANSPVVLKTSAQGFVETESEELFVGVKQEIEKTLFVLPTYLSDELQVIDFSVQKLGDGWDLVSNASEVVLEKGGSYRVLITANIPQSEHGGIFLRLGDKLDIESEKAFLHSFDQPTDARVSWGTVFDSEQSCSSLETRQSSDELKWVSFDYDAPTGVKTLAVYLKVRPQATKLDKINLYYRAFAVKNNVWARTPVDDVLGEVENSFEKESCFAEVLSKSFEVSEGKGVCNDQGCLHVELSSSEETVSNGLRVPLNGVFSVNSFVTSFEETRNPYVKVTSFSNGVLSFNGKDSASIQLNFEASKAIAVFEGDALLPDSFALINIEYGDDSGEILSLDRYLVVEGTGVIVMTVTPSELESNKARDLVVSLHDSNGNALRDARIEINELEGSPLGDSLNGPLYILGDGSFESGEDGSYKFRRVKATSVGTLLVKATRSGFSKAEKTIVVTASDFFDVSPQELSLSCSSGSFQLQSNLDVDVPVTVSLDGNCVSLSKLDLVLSRTGKTASFRVTPNANGECVVAFNSVLPGSGSSTLVEAGVRVDCKDFVETPKGKCSNLNCGDCNEAECIALKTQGNYCLPDYLVTPTGSDFVGCKTGSGPVPPSPGVPCSKSNCAVCVESECRAFESEDNSCVWYPNRTAQSRDVQLGSSISFAGETITLTQIIGDKAILDISDKTILTEVIVGSEVAVGSSAFKVTSISSGKIIVQSVSSGVCAQGSGIVAECTANTCSVCSESECVALEDEKKCTAIYKDDDSFGFCKNYTKVSYDECDDVSQFDFGAMLARRLALAHSDQLLNPNKASYAVASSASNQLVLTPYGWQPVAGGEGCVVTGYDTITCTKKINPLVPRNGLALSVRNQLGADTNIDVAGDVGGCFKIVNVEQRQSFDKNLQWLQDSVAGALGLPQNQYRTYVLEFDATKEGCAEWSLTDNGVELSLTKEQRAGFRLTSTGLLSSQFKVYLNIEVEENSFASELALMLMPEKPVVRGVNLPEPFVVANNLLGKTVSLKQGNNELKINSRTVGLDTTKFTASNTLSLNLGETKTVLEFEEASKTLFNEIGFDVVGNLAVEAKCGGNDYCTDAQLKSYESEIQGKLSNAFSLYSKMDRVKFGGAIQGTKDTFNKAFDEARTEYLLSQQTALMCKELGKDPLAKLREHCSTGTPFELTGSFASVYGDVFGQASCDSEFVNSAFALYGQSFSWDSFKQRLLVGASFKQGVVDYGKPILADPELIVNVPVKVAGSKGGISYWQFKIDSNDLNYYGDFNFNDEGWRSIDSIDGKVGVPSFIDNFKIQGKSGVNGKTINSLTGTHFYV